jgi:hypothetical protein
LSEFYQTFKDELTPVLLQLSHKVQREGTLSTSFHEVSITLILKLDENTTTKTYRPVSLMNICRPCSTTHQKDLHHDQVGFIPGHE